MVSVNVSVAQDSLGRLNDYLRGVAEKTPQKLATETRRAAINICISLRRRTPVARRKKRPSEYLLEPYNVHPKYIHAKDGRLLRRFLYEYKRGTPAAGQRQLWLYTSRHRGPNGRMVGGEDDRRRALEGTRPGTGLAYVKNRELARRSWGWIAHKIYAASSAGDLRWRPFAKNKRDPRKAVDGVFRAFVAGPESGAYATISNALDYVRDIVPDSVVAEAVDAAVKRVVKSAERMVE